MLNIILSLMTLTIMSISSNKFMWWITATSLIMLTFLYTLSTPMTQSFITTFSMLDNMNSCLIILSILISSLMMLASTKILIMKHKTHLFMMLNLILLITLINCFSAQNIFIFYIWFEASLLPTMMIIMLWGYQPERLQASMYMMIYTIIASLPMLLMFYMLSDMSNSTSMSMNTMPVNYSSNMLNMFMITGFLVKLPMFTVHLWLPKAHVEAPIAGSMVLAAILLKLGGYGLLRIMMNIPITSLTAPLCSISLIGGIITSFICMRQPDLKSMIAYSSVGHMGLMLSGMMSNSMWGMTGSLMMMIAHGFSSSALFIMANMTYEMSHTRSTFLMKGMLTHIPTMSMWWFIFVGINMAAPPSINLMSEIILTTAIMSMSMMLMAPLMMMMFLTGAYSLHMYTSTQHGPMNNFSNPHSFMKHKDSTLLLMHLIPTIILIAKIDLISMWI